MTGTLDESQLDDRCCPISGGSGEKHVKKLARFVSIIVLRCLRRFGQHDPLGRRRAEEELDAAGAKDLPQTLSDETMATHPELLSITLHGLAPGQENTYTMFAGSYPERIGNPDDPDDIDVSKKGITILDPRWHRTMTPTRSLSY